MAPDEDARGHLQRIDVDVEALRVLFDSLSVGMYAVDRDGRVTLLNPAAERLLGWRQEELRGRSAHDVIHSADPAQAGPPGSCAVLGVLRTGEPAEDSNDAFTCRDGSRLPVWWSCAPLRVNAAVAGAVVAFSDATEHRTAVRERATERAQHRVDLNAAHETAAERDWLAELTLALTSTLDVTEGLRRLARLVVPRIADWSVADLFDEPDRVTRVAIAHRDPSQVPPDESDRPLPPLTAASRRGLARVLRGAEPLLLDPAALCSTGDEDALDAAQRRLFDALGAGSVIVAPLRARARTLGAMTWVRLPGSPPFDSRDVLLAADLARRAGLAVDNGRLYREQTEIAAAMQRSLLTTLPDLESLELAARYVPARETAEIGGDWYDAFVNRDGVTTLVIGDVAGHDLDAAAKMGQLRNLLRAVAVDRREPPGEVLRRLDRIIDDLGVTDAATCIYARVEGPVGGPWQLAYASAGHPPPLLVTADRQVTMLEQANGLLLGVGIDAPRDSAVVPLPPGSTLLLYTDGLVERRDADLDVGFARLRQVAARHATDDVETFCDAVLATLGDNPGDDTALLALRIPEPGP